jgi:murein DD-endopeptidase MepM/ murein hydrolase activator NlpD
MEGSSVFRRIVKGLFSPLVGAGVLGLGVGVLVSTRSVDANPVAARINNNPWQYGSFPVENFIAYTSPFGPRSAPCAGCSSFHRGLDMAAPLGSPIRSWWSGRVIEVSDNSSCGTSVVIQSGEWTHIYCHMMGHVETTGGRPYLIDRNGGIQIWEGQPVAAGSRVGRVGMTGRTTGPHLHWGLKYARQWVDPALVLRAMYSAPKSGVSSAKNLGTGD